MAISRDGGQTFRKIGQILSPHVARDEFFHSDVLAGMWADGAMVEGDADGHPVQASPKPAASQRYCYLIFTDHNSVQEHYTALSLARVRSADLIEAVRSGRTPAFSKYYSPEGSVADGFFSEPGLGGRSTPVISVPGEYIGTPGVLYDGYLGRFLLFYQVNQKKVVLRTSEDLRHWSEPFVAFALAGPSDKRLFYPSVAGLGPDPLVPGHDLLLYFLVRDRDSLGHWANPQLLREQVSVDTAK